MAAAGQGAFVHKMGVQVQVEKGVGSAANGFMYFPPHRCMSSRTGILGILSKKGGTVFKK